MFPIFLLLVSIFLVIIPIILDPRIEMLFAIGFLLFGIVIYAIFVYYKYEIPCMSKSQSVCHGRRNGGGAGGQLPTQYFANPKNKEFKYNDI